MYMDINFEYYKIFYYVAKYKNITKAATALGSSQPNVTRIIKLLEAQLDCRLFVREPRGLSLTGEGEMLYAHIETACRQLLRVQEKIGEQEMPGSGVIEIGATETALHLFLFDAMRDFKLKYPGIRVKVHNHSTPEILRYLAAGRLDFAVITAPFETPGSFWAEDLHHFREVPVGGTQYQYLRDTNVDRAALAQCPWVGLGRGTATYDFYKHFFTTLGMEVELDMEVATFDLMLPLLLNNFGIGFIPESLALPLFQEKKLVQIPVDFEMPLRAIRLVLDRRQHKSTAADTFCQYLKSRRTPETEQRTSGE